MGDLKAQIAGLGKAAKSASKQLRTATTEQKNQALIGIKNAIDQARISILSANQNDLKLGKKDGLDAALLDRLMLDNDRIDAIITSLEQIAALPDPIGEITDLKYQPSGIQVGKMRMPLGVIGIIYESRPNVTIDAAALCLKSGNAAILRGGSEALNSNLALYDCIQKGLKDAGLNPHTICLIDTKEHAAVAELSRSDQYLDAIIPRGGKGLIEALNKTATIPVIKHLHGVCHTYIDKDADTEKAIAIAFNAKTRRYGVCNATETLLVHNLAAKRVMPELVAKLLKKGVELRGCEKTRAMFQQVIPATKEDWATEYLAPVLSVRIVDSIDDAIDHIEKYGSKHTESIICENFTRARKFLTEVDSSSVMLNASTAFADGFEYGLGAEIGISTDKFHVRGPVGLEGLTSQKYIVLGNGNTRP